MLTRAFKFDCFTQCLIGLCFTWRILYMPWYLQTPDKLSPLIHPSIYVALATILGDTWFYFSRCCELCLGASSEKTRRFFCKRPNVQELACVLKPILFKWSGEETGDFQFDLCIKKTRYDKRALHACDRYGGWCLPAVNWGKYSEKYKLYDLKFPTSPWNHC